MMFNTVYICLKIEAMITSRVEGCGEGCDEDCGENCGEDGGEDCLQAFFFSSV